MFALALRLQIGLHLVESHEVAEIGLVHHGHLTNVGNLVGALGDVIAQRNQANVIRERQVIRQIFYVAFRRRSLDGVSRAFEDITVKLGVPLLVLLSVKFSLSSSSSPAASYASAGKGGVCCNSSGA